MGASESKPSNPVLARIEQEAVRAAVPRGLKDERARELEYDLNWCYNRNSWYFTAGGLLIGLTLGYSMKSVQPVAWAAILAPGGDWLYGQHACSRLQEEYNEHLRRVRREAREQVEKTKAEVRQQYESMMAGGADPAVAAAAVGAQHATHTAAAATPARGEAVGRQQGEGAAAYPEPAATVGAGAGSAPAAPASKVSPVVRRWWWSWGRKPPKNGE